MSRVSWILAVMNAPKLTDLIFKVSLKNEEKPLLQLDFNRRKVLDVDLII
jgi:hypothetical protein